MRPRPLTGMGAIGEGGVVVGPTPPVGDCPFEFGSDDAAIQALFGPNGEALEILAPTKGRYSLDAGVTTAVQFQAGTTIPFPAGQYVFPAGFTGILAFEAIVTLPDLGATTYDGSFLVVCGLIDPQTGRSIPISLYLESDDVWTLSSAAGTYTLGTSGTFRIGVDADLTANTVTYSVDGSPALAAGSITPPANESIPTANMQTSAGDGGNALGINTDIELIQDGSLFTEPHAVGAVALCDALVEKA